MNAAALADAVFGKLRRVLIFDAQDVAVADLVQCCGEVAPEFRAMPLAYRAEDPGASLGLLERDQIQYAAQCEFVFLELEVFEVHVVDCRAACRRLRILGELSLTATERIADICYCRWTTSEFASTNRRSGSENWVGMSNSPSASAWRSDPRPRMRSPW